MDFNPARGPEQAGRRPALVLQADFITEENPGTVIVAAMSTGTHGDDELHVHVEPSRLNGLTMPCVVKCEQLLTLSANRLDRYSGILEPRYLKKVEETLTLILGLE